MKIEERVTWLNKIDMLSHADIISIGSEGCVVPVLDINNHWDLFLKILGLDNRVKIVTPRVSQSEISDVINLLDKIIALRRRLDVVVNDWGVFHYLYSKDCFNIHIGRQLCRSLSDCPWHEEILNNEETSTQKIIKPFSINRRNLIDAGIFGIELNGIPSDMVFEGLDKKIEIAIHEDDYILSCGRTCLIKKIYPFNNCYDICDKKVPITPTGKWMSYFESNVPMSSYEAELLSNVSLNGKKVVRSQGDLKCLLINDIILIKK